MHKVPFYEYIDIIDPTTKFNEIEKKAEKEERYSWSILVEEIKRKVKSNIFIEDFIEKINENIKFSDIYYTTNNKYIDDMMEKKNEENCDNFYKLQKLILLNSLDDKSFYLNQKNKIYKEMEIITMIYFKILDDQNNENLKKLIFKYFDIFEKRRNFIKKFNKHAGIWMHDDDLIINIENEEDIKITVDYIKRKEIIYTNVKLPEIIKIKETHHNNYVKIKRERKINNDYLYIYIIFKRYTEKAEKENNNIVYVNIPVFRLFQRNKIDVDNHYFNNMFDFNSIINILLLSNVKKNKFYNYIYYFDLWKKKHKKYIGQAMTWV